MPRVYDSSGASLSLGPELGRGGEGTVWNTPDQTVVAKVYHNPVESEKIDKLRVMSCAVTPELLRVAAWPTNTLYDRPGGRLVGILLPKVVGHREIHQLYSPAQRRHHFPDRDWSFLLHVAMNCAAAVETVHRAGHVIGDLNQGGVLVSTQGMVRLIDCDSFQVKSSGKLFRCVVGVPQFTPPELQGLNFRNVDRSENHDGFGLALLVFHLLFMGRHPFAGRMNGATDASIEENISAGRFAFNSRAATNQIRPPPHSLSLAALPPRLCTLFERAFDGSGTNGSRPSASEWREALLATKNSLTKCRVDPSHLYSASTAACPWCAIEQGGGPAFFTSVAVTFGFDGSFDLAKAWRQIEAVRQPPTVVALVVPNPPRNVFGRPFPPDCDWRTMGDLRPIPPAPELRLEEVPDPPVFEPYAVPDDPPLQLVTLPEPPPWTDDDFVARIDDEYRRTPQFSDYRTAKWGTLICLAVAAASSWFWPALVGALIMALPFAVTWATYFVPRQRDYRERRKKAIQLSQLRRLAWEREVQRIQRERAEITARNAEIRKEWEDTLLHLAQMREQAPEQNQRRRQNWEAEVVRVARQQDEVKARNRQRCEAHTVETAEYRRAKDAAERHNSRIHQAKQRYEAETRRRREHLGSMLSELEQVQRSWYAEWEKSSGERNSLLQRLAQAKAEYEQLRRSFEQERHQLTLNQRESQLRDHLRAALIEDALISGIGPARKATLESYGIETAFDLDEDALSHINGFGPQRIGELMAWKASVIQRFRFDTKQAVSPTEMRSLHMRFHSRRIALQRELQGGDEQLQENALRAERRLRECNEAIARLVPAIAQGMADVPAA
jgi:DNA-binding helix-hairpin-helix protein with protein kinase domain